MIEKIFSLFRQQIRNQRTRTIILHTLFWLVWLFRSFYDIYTPFGLIGALLFIGAVFITQAPLVYFHLYFLVPRLILKKRYILYIVITASCVFIYSYCNYTIVTMIPEEWTTKLMQSFISRIKPTYDVLEGVIVILLTYALKYTLIAFVTQNELLKLQKEKLQLELNALKTQVNPHFLFNTLNNLYSLTLKNSDKSSEMILKLADIMRYVLYQSEAYQVPLQKELDFIQNYVELQKIRYNENYEIGFSIDGAVNGQIIAPLLLIDFIENAFKHGLDRRFTDGYVNINIHVEKELLMFSVVNAKGHADDGSMLNVKNGIGISNIKKRLELMYPEKYNLDIDDDNEKFNVNLKLNLQ